jgi:sugar/nucleoside kinase (ribokinase family)
MTSSTELDYLVVGHVTRDVVTDGSFRLGGTVCYAARTARACGCRVGVVTSASTELDLAPVLDGVLVARSPASATTTFENIYVNGGRVQMLHAVADVLQPESIPPGWRTSVVHLGPVAQECSPQLLDAVGDAFLGLTPQGWMRRWDQSGQVSYRDWQQPEELLARADAVILSETDVPDRAMLAHYASCTRLLVVTQGAAGCTVYAQGVVRSFPAAARREVDPTGAGDVFAAAFFYWMQRESDPWQAARFANCVAANSVTRVGLAGTPSTEEVDRCRQTMPPAG